MRYWDSALLERLLDVQELDLQIRGITDSIKELQQRCMREDPQLNTLKAELEALTSSIEATKAQKEMYQNTLEDIKSAIKSLITNRARAFKPRNRSSTEALRTEEEKLSILLVETDEQIELLQKNCNLILERIEFRTNEVQKAQQAPEAEIKIHTNEVVLLEEKKQILIQGIPPSLIKKYDRLRTSRSGIGLTILIDGICRVCRMEMPTGLKSKLLQGFSIDNCPACGRMIAKIENTIDHKQIAQKAREEQEKRMREEEEQERLSEVKRLVEEKAAKKAQRALERQQKKEKEERTKKRAIEKEKKEAAQKEASIIAAEPSKVKESKSVKSEADLKKQKINIDDTNKTNAVKKVTAKKKPPKKAAAKKDSSKETSSKKTAAKKDSSKETSSKKTAAKKVTAKKTPPKKAAAKKDSSKETTAKKSAVKKISKKAK